MKNMKKTLLSALLGAAVLAPAMAQAGWSANAGYTSQYHFRGVQQTETGSASAGVDYENGNFSFGVWAADVDAGLEIDIYGGYGVELESGISFGVGLITYQYTNDVFDSSYNEVNLTAGKGGFGLELTFGTHEDGNAPGDDASYTFVGATYEADSGVYGTFGTFGGDWEGSYLEAGYGTSVGEFDLGVAVIISNSDLDDDEALTFSIGKSFDL